jgi:hypothetical protein
MVVIFTFLWASCKNPGVLRPDPSFSFLELLRDINPADLCPECKLIRSARSRHCAICNQCVERFDHHCPWINNCVGAHNHNAFLSFLLSIWFKIAFHSYFDVYSLIRFTQNYDDVCCLEEYCIYYCLKDLCTNKVVHIVCCSICIVICLFYMLMSSLLLYTHCRNYMANRTTNERFSRRGKKSKVKNNGESEEDSETE